MNPGIGVSLVFILTLVLAIISSAQAFEPFFRQPEGAPHPARLIDRVAGEARQPADVASVGERTFFSASDAAYGYEPGRSMPPYLGSAADEGDDGLWAVALPETTSSRL